MKNEPTLLILIPGFPRDEEDSTCLPSQQHFIRSINKNFPFVKLIILSFQYPYFKKEYSWNNNRVIAFGGGNKGGLARFFLWHSIRKKLSELKKENNIIGLLSFWGGECALIGKSWANKNGIKHYCWLMGQDAKEGNHYIKRMQPNGTELIALSDFICEEVENNHDIKPQHIIPLGVEMHPVAREQTYRDIDIICAGSLIPLKQFHLCADIAVEIKKQYPSLKIVVCGKGPEEERIKSLIQKNGLQDNITLLGEKKHNEVLELMNRSKILVHLSSYEGFGVVCLEALAAGATVVSFHKPMKKSIEKWHIVYSVKEMTDKVLSLLLARPDYTPVYPYLIDGSAKAIMNLFGVQSRKL